MLRTRLSTPVIQQPKSNEHAYYYVDSLKFNYPLMSKGAISHFNGAMYDLHDTSVWTLDETKDKDYVKYDFDFENSEKKTKIFAKHAGYLDRRSKEFLSKHFCLNESDLMFGKKQDGGHNMLRFVTNLLLVENFNLFLSSNNNNNVVLIDVGAKFGKMSNLKVLSNWKFCYQPVRPRVDEYDKKYFSQNEARYIELHKKHPELFGPLWEGYLNDFIDDINDLLLAGKVVVFFMNDVHYYMDNFQVEKLKKN